MKLTNLMYMQNEEFKTRQSAFSFFCAKSLEFLIAFKKECVSGWREIFTRDEQTTAPQQLTLTFDAVVLFWANWMPEKNMRLIGA